MKSRQVEISGYGNLQTMSTDKWTQRTWGCPPHCHPLNPGFCRHCFLSGMPCIQLYLQEKEVSCQSMCIKLH